MSYCFHFHCLFFLVTGQWFSIENLSVFCIHSFKGIKKHPLCGRSAVVTTVPRENKLGRAAIGHEAAQGSTVPCTAAYVINNIASGATQME